MATEENTAFVQAIEELWFKGNSAVVDQLYATDFIEHDPVPGQPPGSAGLSNTLRCYALLFPTAAGRSTM